MGFTNSAFTRLLSLRSFCKEPTGITSQRSRSSAVCGTQDRRARCLIVAGCRGISKLARIQDIRESQALLGRSHVLRENQFFYVLPLFSRRARILAKEVPHSTQMVHLGCTRLRQDPQRISVYALPPHNCKSVSVCLCLRCAQTSYSKAHEERLRQRATEYRKLLWLLGLLRARLWDCTGSRCLAETSCRQALAREFDRHPPPAGRSSNSQSTIPMKM